MSSFDVIKEFFGEISTPVAVATSDDNKPSVRFLGFKMYVDEKVYFMTSRSKSFFKELEKNPQIQLCSLPNKKSEWVRMDAKAVFSEDLDLIQKAFDIFPMFKQMFKTIDNKDIGLFYLDSVKAKKQSLVAADQEL